MNCDDLFERLKYQRVVDERGVIRYYNANGQLHREDGPAMIYSFGKGWYINGKRHRTDGPAIIDADGYRVWYIDGKILTEGEFNARNSNEQ